MTVGRYRFGDDLHDNHTGLITAGSDTVRRSGCPRCPQERNHEPAPNCRTPPSNPGYVLNAPGSGKLHDLVDVVDPGRDAAPMVRRPDVLAWLPRPGGRPGHPLVSARS